MSAVKLMRLIADNARLRGRFTLSENSDPQRLENYLAEADIIWAGRKFSVHHHRSTLRKLRWVQVTSAGVETWLERWPEAVQLTNVSGVHGDKGAEFILMAALMINYGIPGFVDDRSIQRWRPVFGGCARGQKATLLGLGGIGAAAADMLTRFGYQVCGVTRGGQTAANVARCVSIADVDAELVDTDVLISTLQLTRETDGLFDRARLALLPAHAGVVIVGRAKVFDYAALREMLIDRRLSGAVLDVFAREPLPAGDALWQCPRLIMTPHCSLDDHGTYLDACLAVFMQNLERYVAGEPLLNRVNAETGY